MGGMRILIEGKKTGKTEVYSFFESLAGKYEFHTFVTFNLQEVIDNFPDLLVISSKGTLQQNKKNLHLLKKQIHSISIIFFSGKQLSAKEVNSLSDFPIDDIILATDNPHITELRISKLVNLYKSVTGINVMNKTTYPDSNRLFPNFALPGSLDLKPGERQEPWQEIANITNNGIIILKDDFIRNVNNTFLSMSGYLAKELVNIDFIHYLVPDKYIPLVSEFIYKESQHPIEIELKHKEGQTFPVEIESERKSSDSGNQRYYPDEGY